MPLELSQGQYDLVYNAFSFTIAAMGASLLLFLLMRNQVHVTYRIAVTISTLVVAIALYHYLRIFNSWADAFTFTDGRFVQDGPPFNEGYRYVDWLLTVPLLLAELVLVLKLAKDTTRSLIIRLTVAAVLMIGLGYPGEIAAADSATRTVFGILSTIPFLYILYVLFVELGRSLDRQSPRVRKLVDALRYIVLITWGVYPLAYIAPSVISDEATAEVVRQVGYSVADVLAKPLFGILILSIALTKSRADDELVAEGLPRASEVDRV
ncbi:MAG: bacteriorhodopsin-like [Acidimicrobiales bacterium]|jgi:bacteriorhodopsin|nr:bacteriorhodopsin-like [Acidimicrobiales bacterium]